MVHHAASSGYAKHAELYGQARPRYHHDLVERFVELYGHGLVVDLGAGTGIFTDDLVRANVDVVAIEPVMSMASQLRSHSPEALLAAGSAEALPLRSSSVNTVLCAQAFHWFDHSPALIEIARVLVPDGFLVTAWNIRDERIDWVRGYTELMDRFAGDAPREGSGIWRNAIEAGESFRLSVEYSVGNPRPTNAEQVVARALSTSFIAALDPADQAGVAREVADLVKPLGDSFEYPYRSEFQAWQKVG